MRWGGRVCHSERKSSCSKLQPADSKHNFQPDIKADSQPLQILPPSQLGGLALKYHVTTLSQSCCMTAP